MLLFLAATETQKLEYYDLMWKFNLVIPTVIKRQFPLQIGYAPIHNRVWRMKSRKKEEQQR